MRLRSLAVFLIALMLGSVLPTAGAGAVRRSRRRRHQIIQRLAGARRDGYGHQQTVGGATRTVVSAGDGSYRIDLEPGRYSVTVELQGFQKVQADDMLILLGRTVDFPAEALGWRA